MKSIIFDSGPIISLAINGLLWSVKDLKARFEGEFYVTQEVKKEIVDTPLNSKRFKFEALRVLHQIDKERIKIIQTDEIVNLGKELMQLANNIFKVRGTYLKIVDIGEMESVAAAILLKSEVLVTDERITRYLIDSPERLENLLKRRHKTSLHIEHDNLNKFRELAKDVKVIRSLELVAVAFEKGILDKYISEKEEKEIPDLRKKLLESVLWGVKLNGCAASKEDIAEIMKLEGF